MSYQIINDKEFFMIISKPAKIASNLSKNSATFIIFEDGILETESTKFYISKYKNEVDYKIINADNFNILTPFIIIYWVLYLISRFFNGLNNN